MYPRAAAQLASFSGGIDRRNVEVGDTHDRIDSSPPSVERLLEEARATKDSSLHESLLVEAAKLALEQKSWKLAVDLNAELRPKDDAQRGATEESIKRLYYDQFSGKVIGGALAADDMESVEYAYKNLLSPLSRAGEAQKIAAHLHKIGQDREAEERLDRAVSELRKLDDDAAKSSMLLRTASAYAAIDPPRVSEVMRAAIKSFDGLLEPKADEKRDSPARQKYVKDLIQLSYQIIPARALSITTLPV